MACVAKRDGKKESKWRRHVAGQVTGGLPVRAYCRARGLSENSFYWWRRELQRRDQGKAAVARDISRIFRPLSPDTFSNKGIAKIVLSTKGGHGVVRELLDVLRTKEQ